MAEFSPFAIDSFERKLLVGFSAGAVVVGLGFSAVLAAKLDGREHIPTDYWDKLLTIAGVSALPIVALAFLVARSAMSAQSPLGYWGAGIVIGAMVAFAASMVVILICLFQIVVAADAAEHTVPKAPDDWVIWVATVGTGLTLSGVAVGVAAAALDKIDI